MAESPISTPLDIITVPRIENVQVLSRFHPVSHGNATSNSEKEFSLGSLFKTGMKKSVSYASGLLNSHGVLPPALVKQRSVLGPTVRPDMQGAITGALNINATHLLFFPDGRMNNLDNKNELWILHCHIQSVQMLPPDHFQAAGKMLRGYPVKIRCKNFRCITFIIFDETDAKVFQRDISRLSLPRSIFELPCFSFVADEEQRGEIDRASAWKMIRMESDFERMGLPNKKWRLCALNKNFKLSETYPETLYVPAAASDEVVYGSAVFRSKHRVPALTYLHSSGGVIVRCSQPLAGFNNRSASDEKLIELMKNSAPRSKRDNVVFLCDTRPKINAVANRAKGKGYEHEANYDGMVSEFFNIENIHVMRSSLQKLNDACDYNFRQSFFPNSEEGDMAKIKDFYSALDASSWSKHIQTVLEAGRYIADRVSKGYTAIVHCSDGWDRTAQTCAIAQLIMDPYYRTLDGFMALIEKDFLSFGHKFTDRCGHLCGPIGTPSFTAPEDKLRRYHEANPPVEKQQYSVERAASFSGILANENYFDLGDDDDDDPDLLYRRQSDTEMDTVESFTPVMVSTKESSPIFTQFLDATHQLLCKYPASFQFNDQLLIKLQDAVYGCRYGTFVGNSEKQRRDAEIAKRTPSFWAHVRLNANEFVNPLYLYESEGDEMLPHVFSGQDISFWNSMYMRFDNDLRHKQFLFRGISKLKKTKEKIEREKS